jgi:hypothetical protein
MSEGGTARERPTEPLCPSARAEPGTKLIGAVQADGRVAHFGTALPVDEAFLRAASPYGPAEQRFRFSSSCVEGRCAQWTGRQCGLIDQIMQHLTNVDAAAACDPLPRCPIRGACSWWL